MIFLNWLKPVAYPEKLQDPSLIKQIYKRYRLRTFFGMYIGYAFYYFTRKSLTFAMPAMLNDGFSITELGMLGSVLSIVYGISKFVSGVMGDKSNPRYFMSFGLILTGIFNLFFGLSSLWVSFAIFWALNAWFQGWGWPGCAKLLTHWYSQSERGTWWSLWNTSHNVGGALIPLLAAFCAAHFGWRSAMLLPGALSILVGFFLIYTLRDVPESLGLPPIETLKGESVLLEEKRESLTVKEILFKYVLFNEAIWLVAFAYFFIYIIRIGFNDWCMVYLVKFKGYTTLKAASCILWFEIGGFIGSIFSGWASDKLFKGKRNPVNLLFTAGAIASLFALHQARGSWLLLDSLFIFFIGFFIFGPQMLIGMVAAELSHKKAAATSSGFAGCFAYLGAAIAGGPLGMLIHSWGWDVFFAALIGCGIVASGLLLPILSKSSNAKSLALTPLREEEEKLWTKIFKSSLF